MSNTEQVREWRRANPAKAKAIKDRYVAAHREKVRESVRRKNLQRYGITVEAWEALFESQGRKCAVCTSEVHGGNGWHTDHCHSTGEVRGILCVRCNIGIGQFADDATRLRAAAAYLEKSRG